MRNRIGGIAVLLASVVVLQACATAASFQGPVSATRQVAAYPQRGQSPEQTAKDKAECEKWAFAETGQRKPGEEGLKAGAEAATLYGAIGAVTGALTGGFLSGWGSYSSVNGVLSGAGLEGTFDAKNEATRAGKDAYAEAQGKYERAYALCLKNRGYDISS